MRVSEIVQPKGRGDTAAASLDRAARPDHLSGLEDFFENGAVALHFVGGDGSILKANKAELDLLGYAPEEYIGQNIADFHADAPVIADILLRLGSGEKIEKYPARLKAKDGSIKDVEITSSVQFRDGIFLNTRCFTIDVTELRRAQTLIAEKQKHLEQVLEALPAAVYTTDAAGRVTYFNRAAVDLAGRTPDLGSDEWCVTWKMRDVDGQPLPHDQCPMAVALRENRPVRGVEALAERPDGELIPFLPFPTPLHDEKGELRGAVNMLVDISERKASESQQRMLLSELNHRIKNNLQMLSSLLNMSQRKAKQAAAKAILKDAAQRVAAMAAAQRLLYDARKPHSFSAADFLHAVCDAAKQSFEADVNLIVTRADGDLTNDAATPLALILNELLTNAVKHNTNQRVAISTSIRQSGQECELVVENDGPGFKLPRALKPHGGLGLVTGLARQLGGTFDVEKTESGMRCVVRFPIGTKLVTQKTP